MTGALNAACFCDCCVAPAPRAPIDVSNRPGLSQIGFRIGMFATFREALLERINAEPALAALTTRDSDDYAITLFELSAAVGDVLSFYNERIANEIYLRTAQQRDSVLRLVRLIGYRLRPGLAATTLLAFTLDAGAQARIRQGLKVMSLPAQDETPQTFETLEEIVAHGDLNEVPAFAPPILFNAFQTGRTGAPLSECAFAAVARRPHGVFRPRSRSRKRPSRPCRPVPAATGCSSPRRCRPRPGGPISLGPKRPSAGCASSATTRPTIINPTIPRSRP